jgi:hypothetical protein
MMFQYFEHSVVEEYSSVVNSDIHQHSYTFVYVQQRFDNMRVEFIVQTFHAFNFYTYILFFNNKYTYKIQIIPLDKCRHSNSCNATIEL